LSAHPGTPGPEIAADLSVLKPLVRSGLDTDRIAVSYPDRRLDYYAGARWSASLDEVVQEMALQSFHTHANLRSVSSDASVFSAGYWLEIDVDDFQAEYTTGEAIPTIHVHFSARLGKASDRRILSRFDASATQLARRQSLDARSSRPTSRRRDRCCAALAEIVAETARVLGAEALSSDRRTRALALEPIDGLKALAIGS
jgi:ABC-type uncharacterized transport system auxiliary subunit